MAHSIGLGFINLDEKAERVLAGVLENKVIPTANIRIVEADESKREKCTALGIHCEPDLPASTLRSEIVVLSGERRSFPTLLSSICGVTRGKILISLIENRGIEYIQERVAKATHVVVVEQETKEDGTLVSRLTYSNRFPNHMKSVIVDTFQSIGELEIAE